MFKKWRSNRSNRDGTSKKETEVSSQVSFDLRNPTPMSSSPSRVGQSRSLGPSGLGLQLIHNPKHTATVDIVFVHGLGGHSRRTWSKDHDPLLCWPELWLPFEPDIRKARIFSFGYNANFRAGSLQSVTNISDFAKELLYEMAFCKDENNEDMRIGSVPIVFIVHSMGGLVVKKAYLLGYYDDNYKHIIRSISAIMFLATPHRGSNLAETLSRVLTISFQTSKPFIGELSKNTSAIEDINEQFRHFADKLSIISFYETLATSIGPMKFMIVDKDSAVLGYAKEISRPLNADHHDVCKFSSPEDSNYISVRNTLNTLVRRLHLSSIYTINQRKTIGSKNAEDLLGISSTYEDDYNSFRRFWIQDTCSWFLHNSKVQTWLELTLEPHVMWYTAPPGSGKSVLATFMIDHLRESGSLCHYFFFKFNDQTKRSISGLLRSLAYQVMKDITTFQNLLHEISAEGLRLANHDSTSIWQKLFAGLLFKIEIKQPLFWIIDALDEADVPRVFLDLLQSIKQSKVPLHILIISRPTQTLSVAFARLSSSIKVDEIDSGSESHNSPDIKTFVSHEIRHMRGSEELKESIQRQILNRANGNFLWVRLVLENIMDCHTPEDIEEELSNIPTGMNELYERMELTISKTPGKGNRRLSKAILEWAICSQRSLFLKELSQALQPEFSSFLDLKSTIRDVCGQFVLVDQEERLSLVHQTARDYLIESAGQEIIIEPKRAHGELFRKTICQFLAQKIQSKLIQGQHAVQGSDPFLFYAASSWPYHLIHSHSSIEDHLDLLVKFFQTDSVLVWINALAIIDKTELLIKTAKAISSFATHFRRVNLAKDTSYHRLSDLELLNQWAIDLVKIMGKFGRHLLSNPAGIYMLVPPLCPTRSMIYQRFYQQSGAELSVLGNVDTDWSDCLAKITLPKNAQAWKIACEGQYVAALGFSGLIFLWNTSNFTEVCTLRHLEPVTVICFNSNGRLLASYGMKHTKIWSIPSADLVGSIPNPVDSKAMDIEFTGDDSQLIMGGEDKIIRILDIQNINEGWKTVTDAIMKESSSADGMILSTPMCLAFNGDRTQVGVSYRGAPLAVWSLDKQHCIRRCRHAGESSGDHRNRIKTWFAVDRFTWNPITGHVIGLYKDGSIFKWHPVTDEYQQTRQDRQSAADELAASPDGKLFVTSNSNGTVKIWDFLPLTTIYQLNSSDLVSGLTFSPDSRQFYDVRGSFITAWQSNSLLRFLETEETSSDCESEVYSSSSNLLSSHAMLPQFVTTTAMAVAPNGHWCCYGDEDGIVWLIDAVSDKCIEVAKFSNLLNVDRITWSEDSTLVAAADLAGDVLIKRITPSHSSHSIDQGCISSLPTPKLEFEEGVIQQMLFNKSGELLLIITQRYGEIWSIKEGKRAISVLLKSNFSRWWMPHPTRNEFFLSLEADKGRVYRWTDFLEQRDLAIRGTRQRRNSGSVINETGGPLQNQEFLFPGSGELQSRASSSIVKAVLSSSNKILLVQANDVVHQGFVPRRVYIIDTETLDWGSDDSTEISLLYKEIPTVVLAQVETVLGILPGPRLAFLDQDLWVCTWNIGVVHGEQEIERHFFVPRDWVSSEGLDYCSVVEDGTLFVPRDNKVTIIRSNLSSVSF